MFGLYMLAIYLGVAVIAAGFVALLVVVALAVGLVTHPIRTLAEWILERPTRAERRAMKRAAAQETGRVTMRMPVSKEVAAAFESTRDGRRASL